MGMKFHQILILKSIFWALAWWRDLADLQALFCQLFCCMLPVLPDIPIKDAKGIGWSCMTFSISDHCRCRDAPSAQISAGKMVMQPEGSGRLSKPFEKKRTKGAGIWKASSKLSHLIKAWNDFWLDKRKQATLLRTSRVTYYVWSSLENLQIFHRAKRFRKFPPAAVFWFACRW